MSGRLDGYIWVDNPRSAGSTYDPENEGYPYRIVLHTIEGRGFPNLSAHQYPPHLWVNPATRQRYQTVPLDRGAFALYQASSAPYYTNRARALQVELVGFAEEAGGWPDEHLVNIAQDVIVPLVEWVREQGGDIDLSDAAVPLPGAIPNSAREDAPQRLDPHVWAFGPIGLCGHRHVPMGDDHWDTGALDLRKIAAYARELLGTSGSAGTVTPSKPAPIQLPKEGEPMILLWADPAQKGSNTQYVVDFQGNAWALTSEATIGVLASPEVGLLPPGTKLGKAVSPQTITTYLHYRGYWEAKKGVAPFFQREASCPEGNP